MITDYSSLQTAIANWLNRSDLTSQIPEFIQMAEGRLKRDPRVRDISASSGAITSLSGVSTTNWLLTGHPDIYLYASLVETAPYLKDDERVPVWKQELETRLAELGTSRLDMARTLGLASYADLQEMVAEYLNRPDLAPLTPALVTLAEASLKRDLAGAPTITALSAGSNWLIEGHPDVYLYATLCEAAPWLGPQDEARLQTWKALRDAGVQGVLRTRTATAYDLATYAGLQTAIKGWLNRTDIDPAALITLAEASLKRALAGSATITALSGGVNWLFQSHPDVYLYAALVEAAPYLGDDARVPMWKAALEERVEEVRRARTETAYDLTTYAGLQSAVKGWLDRSDLENKVPAFIALAEASLKRELAGAAAITSLSGVNTSNWVLASHPDAYLYGALAESAPYLKDDPRVALWKQRFDEAVEEIRRARTDTAYDLSSYAGLLTAIKGWTDRQDIDAAALVTLAEKSLGRDPRLRKLKSAAFSITVDDVAVPSDYHSLQTWTHDSSTLKGSIYIVGADQLPDIKSRVGNSGVPAYAAIIDGKFRFAPEPDGTYATKMTYWRTIGSASAGTSWLFSESPDLYLYAALVAAEPYLKNDPRIATWKALLEAEIENVHQETSAYHFSGTMRRAIRAIGG